MGTSVRARYAVAVAALQDGFEGLARCLREFAGQWGTLVSSQRTRREQRGGPVADRFDRERFEALVLYIAHQTADDETFGRVKLAKVLFYSDFDVYRDQGESLTGATYIRMPRGPFPRQLGEAEKALEATGQVVLEHEGKDEYEEKRIVPQGSPPELGGLFEQWQLLTVDARIKEIQSASARRASDLSHDHPGWRLASENGVEIPYSTALLPQERPSAQDAEDAKRIARERGWLTERGWIWEREPA